ncbi:MAG: ABC transporter ATP-binding protein [Planctomycetia bacterium]|nr:ABC transporter ATP-binding protein [Planctomycetia bacterium]
MLKLEDVSLRLDSRFALDEVSLAVRPGEYFVLLGPTGSGKTLLLECIAGLRRPDAGRIVIADDDVTAAPPENRGTGFVYQHSELFPHMSVRENVQYGLRARQVPKEQMRRRATEMLDFLSIAGLADRRPGNLSGGERKCVALARALVVQPRVLLLDEPLSAADTSQQADLRRHLRRINRELGTTVLHVTHDLEEAFTLAESVAVLRDGRIVQSGRPADVFHRPGSAFVADLVGVENLFHGTVEAGRACVDGTDIMLDVATDHAGPAWLGLRSDEILLSADRLTSSARNCIIGTIAAIEPGPLVVKVTVECGSPGRYDAGFEEAGRGGLKFVIAITRLSLAEMALEVGKKVWVTFKATSLHVWAG